MKSKKINLYEKIADDISRLIDEGTFRPGDRILSLRNLSLQLKVSMATAMEAYRLLEDRGLIEARPQSGYYVRPYYHQLIPEPGENASGRRKPAAVSMDELARMVVQDSRNPDLLPLGAAVPNPDLLPVTKLNRVLAAMVRKKGVQSIGYEMGAGSEALRVQIARRAMLSGCALSPREIIITTGCQEAVMLSLMAVCRPGDSVVVEAPTYYTHLQAIEVLRLKAVEIPVHPREGISLDALGAALKKRTIRACLLVPNFNNPMGSCMPDDRKKALVDMLGKKEVFVIEDDIYGDLCFSSQRPRVIKAFDRQEKVILCSSFSKTLAPGYRIGWVAPGRFKTEIERLKLTNTLASATPPQLAIAEFLANGGYDHHLRRIRRIHAQQVWLMTKAVAKFFPQGTRVSRPAGGYVLWVELPEQINSLKLYEAGLKAGITIAPGPLFSATGKYRNCVRLNAAFWSDKIEAGIATLGELSKRISKN